LQAGLPLRTFCGKIIWNVTPCTVRGAYPGEGSFLKKWENGMRKAVVYGATGVIGRALVQALLASSVEVLALAHPASTRAAALPQHPLLRVETYPKGAELPNAVGGFDAFFHLAWAGTYGAARADAALQEGNLTLTADAVALAARLGCAVFVGVGSQAEYGCVPVGQAVTEETPCHPVTAYGAAKLRAGQESCAQCKALGMRHVWARVFSVYGEGDRNETLMMHLLASLLANRAVELTAGEQIWDYLHAADAARALILLAERGRDCTVYNVASGVSRPLRELVSDIRDAVAPRGVLRFGALPYAAGQPMNLGADISRLVRDTGFAPQIGLVRGVTALADALREGNL
jgi:nucleoside-diphosphate-sugar epimerase